MQTYCLLFYAKRTKGNSELSAVYMRITIDGKRKEISTGKTIKTTEWNSKAGKVFGNSSYAKSFNSFLESLRAKMFESYNHLLNNRKIITCEGLRNRFLGIDERNFGSFDFFVLKSI